MQIMKSAPSFIIETRNSLNEALQNLRSLNLNFEWMDFDLKSDLVLFHTKFDMNALRKISLQGEVNAYR